MGTSGGGFDNLNTDDGSAITIVDTVNLTTVSVTTGDVTENDAGVMFEFQLSNPPQEGVPASLTVEIGGELYTVVM